MKKLDKYIIKKLLATFVYSIALLSVIIIVFDISEKISGFLDHKAPIKAIVLDYYLNFLPYLVVMFTPLFLFISVIFFTTKMTERSETTAILSSGITFHRFMVPYLIGASIVASMNLYFNHFLIPKANKVRLAFEEKYYHHGFQNRDKHIHIKLNDTTYIYMLSFDASENRANVFTKEHIKDKELTYKLRAQQLTWDTLRSKWAGSGVKEVFYTKEGTPKTINDYLLRDVEVDLLPSEFKHRENYIETMNYTELNQHIISEQFKGKNVDKVYVEKYKRTSMPFACLILTIIAISLTTKKQKGGIGFQIGLGVSISFIYIFLMQITATIAINMGTNILLSVWIPNILFTALAGFLYRRASS